MLNEERIDELLDEAYSTDDEGEMERLAREVIEMDEDNVEAMILLADAGEFSEEKIRILERARDVLSDDVEALLANEDASFLEDDTGMLYIAVLQRLGFAHFSEGNNEEALEIALEILKHDPEQETLGKTLFYTVLLDMKRDAEVIEETLKDEVESLAMLHARAIAAFRLTGGDRGAYRALWDAFAAGPEIPFHILGYYGELGDDASDDDYEDYNFAVLFEDQWSSEPELINWLARGTILFGLTASLFPKEDVEKMMVLADALDIADSVEEALVKVEGRPEWPTLSREEKIAEALSLFSSGVYLPLSSPGKPADKD